MLNINIDFRPLVEEMDCPHCEALTGHELSGDHWACIHCNTKRVGEAGLFKRMFNAIFKRNKNGNNDKSKKEVAH